MSRTDLASQLPTRVVVFFAANPDEELTPGDIDLKWPPRAVSARCVSTSMAALLRSGLVSRIVLDATVGHRRIVYRAGPVLLQMLGRKGGVA